jgi:hypothetical protein
MKNRKLILTIVCVLAVLLAGWLMTRSRSDASADRLLLLVPDKVKFDDPRVTMWVDAGDEEGLHVVPMHDSEFVRPFLQKTDFAGVILPDSIHQQAGDPLIHSLRQFVARGGNLMLVYDAGTLSLTGRYAAGQSRLSDLAGVKYALYDQLKDKTTIWNKIKASKKTFDELGVPPGKYYPFQNISGKTPDDSEVELRRYMYGDLQYPSFVTSGDYAGKLILKSDAGVIAGENSYKSGKVLFVNLPLGYLKGNTDGLPLHAFLNHFATKVLSLPRLLPVPDGVGGLVLNWHVDSNAAIKPLQSMESWRILLQGPYSVHITAGPDAMEFGDRRGFNVEHNQISQAVIRDYEARGYAIGSHGGWIHNYFAAHVDTGNPKDLEQFLALNKDALEHVTGKPVIEYSAPNGNQPTWVTEWLEAHGFVAYYFTGDTGMGPTIGYRNGKREGQNIWAFPMLHLNTAAAFEEFEQDNYPHAEIEAWLEGVADFAASHQSVRLIYFHPPGILEYRPIIRQWLEKTKALQGEGRFRWYTMSSLANFLNTRKKVSWKISYQGGKANLEASHPESLEHETWRLPVSKFAEPKVVEGDAKIEKNDDSWLIVAGKDKKLRIEAGMLNQ